MLHLHDIESGYGAGQVLFGISLSVPAGHVVSLMGRNGMGKTTTIRTIMGQLPLTGGSISRFGNNQPDQLPFQIARLGVGLVAEGRQIFSNLDVTENLKTFYRPPRDDGGSHWHYERVLDLFPQLAERRDHAGNHLSGGEQHGDIGRSPILWDAHGVAFKDAGLDDQNRTQQARHQEAEQAPQFLEPVLDGRTRQTQPVLRVQRKRCPRRLRPRILDGLGLVENAVRPGALTQQGSV